MTEKTAPQPIPEGLGVEYSYYDPDDKTRRRDIADYVAEPITRESLGHREEDDSDA